MPGTVYLFAYCLCGGGQISKPSPIFFRQLSCRWVLVNFHPPNRHSNTKMPKLLSASTFGRPDVVNVDNGLSNQVLRLNCVVVGWSMPCDKAARWPAEAGGEQDPYQKRLRRRVRRCTPATLVGLAGRRDSKPPHALTPLFWTYAMYWWRSAVFRVSESDKTRGLRCCRSRRTAT